MLSNKAVRKNKKVSRNNSNNHNNINNKQKAIENSTRLPSLYKPFSNASTSSCHPIIPSNSRSHSRSVSSHRDIDAASLRSCPIHGDAIKSFQHNDIVRVLVSPKDATSMKALFAPNTNLRIQFHEPAEMGIKKIVSHLQSKWKEKDFARPIGGTVHVRVFPTVEPTNGCAECQHAVQFGWGVHDLAKLGCIAEVWKQESKSADESKSKDGKRNVVTLPLCFTLDTEDPTAKCMQAYVKKFGRTPRKRPKQNSVSATYGGGIDQLSEFGNRRDVTEILLKKHVEPPKVINSPKRPRHCLDDDSLLNITNEFENPQPISESHFNSWRPIPDVCDAHDQCETQWHDPFTSDNNSNLLNNMKALDLSINTQSASSYPLEWTHEAVKYKKKHKRKFDKQQKCEQATKTLDTQPLKQTTTNDSNKKQEVFASKNALTENVVLSLPRPAIPKDRKMESKPPTTKVDDLISEKKNDTNVDVDVSVDGNGMVVDISCFKKKPKKKSKKRKYDVDAAECKRCHLFFDTSYAFTFFFYASLLSLSLVCILIEHSLLALPITCFCIQQLQVDSVMSPDPTRKVQKQNLEFINMHVPKEPDASQWLVFSCPLPVLSHSFSLSLVEAGELQSFRLQFDFKRIKVDKRTRLGPQIEGFQKQIMQRLQTALNHFFTHGCGIVGLNDSPGTSDLWALFALFMNVGEAHRPLLEDFLVCLEFCVQSKEWEIQTKDTRFDANGHFNLYLHRPNRNQDIRISCDLAPGQLKAIDFPGWTNITVNTRTLDQIVQGSGQYEKDKPLRMHEILSLVNTALNARR